MEIRPKGNFKKKAQGIARLLCFLYFLFLIFAPEISRAAGASFYLSPSSGTFFIGSTFDVSIFINTGGEDVNAVEVDIKFDPRKLQVASPTAGKSFIEVWVTQPVYDNNKGEISFVGGIPSPGINTTAGLVSTVTFRAIAPGETTIYFSNNSKILRNDSVGTNILTSLGRGVYNLVVPPPEGPEIFSSTHPDRNKWYRDNNPTFCWEKETGVTGFSYIFTKNPGEIPDNHSEGDHTCISYSDVEDGIWYFSIKSVKNGIWGGTSHYPVQIDTTPPAIFTPTVDPGLKTIENEPLISFITTDALSGISHYEIKYINITSEKEEAVGFFREVSSPYKIPRLEVGKYLIVVRAHDLAGNYQEGTEKIEILSKGISFSRKGIHYWRFLIPWWILILILLFAVLVVLNLVYKKYRKLNKKIKNKPEKGIKNKGFSLLKDVDRNEKEGDDEQK